MNVPARRSRGRRPGPAAALLAGLLLAGCASGVPAASAPAPATAGSPPCARPEGAHLASTRADVLADTVAGEFRLTLVAERGPRAGRSASGRLTLLPYGSGPAPVPVAPDVGVPLYGGTDVDIAQVGAVAPGEVSRADPARPGVLGMEWVRPGAPAGGREPGRELTLRLGADANHGGRLRFDGAYTALTVTALSAHGFGGTWRSGGGGEADAEGYFCAVRMAARG